MTNQSEYHDRHRDHGDTRSPRGTPRASAQPDHRDTPRSSTRPAHNEQVLSPRSPSKDHPRSDHKEVRNDSRDTAKDTPQKPQDKKPAVISPHGEASTVKEISLDACRRYFDRLSRRQSMANAVEVEFSDDMVTMSPMIYAMLKVCPLTLGGGCTWVVCAPTEQGKTISAEFLMHGAHSMRPRRSLKIDATNMTDFAKDFSALLKCPVAELCLSKLLCEALSNTAPATEASTAEELVGYTAKDFKRTKIQVRDAEKHDILRMTTLCEDLEPSPILIIDEFDCNTEKNKGFVRTLMRDAAAKGIAVFLLTKDQTWATELIKLNDGTKCKPLPENVDNSGYTGATRFAEKPKWNSMAWSVDLLRYYVEPLCQKYELDPANVIRDNTKYSPAEAMKVVTNIQIEKQLGTYKEPEEKDDDEDTIGWAQHLEYLQSVLSLDA